MSNKRAKTYKQTAHAYGSKQEYCETEKDMDYNPNTNRCLKKCPKTKKRNTQTYKCVSLKQRGTAKSAKNKMEICHSQNMDYNPKTNRCLKKCKPGHTRSEKSNKCVSLKSRNKPIVEPAEYILSIPIEPIKRAKNDEIENTLNFILKIEESGRTFRETGLKYRAYAMLFTLATLYLLEKYKNDCFVLQQAKTTKGTGVNFGVTYMFNIGSEGDSYNFNKLKILNKPINKFIHQIFKCIQKMKPSDEVIFIPIQFKLKVANGPDFNHANLLVYRKTLNILEHFEPHGKFYKYNNGTLFLEDIVKLMNVNNRKLNYKYYHMDLAYANPILGCPYGFVGFQRIEASLPKLNPGVTENGYCIMWSIFMAEMALMNPTMRNYEIIDKVYTWLDRDNNKNPEYLTNVIRGYYHFVHKYMTEHLKTVYNMNIDVSNEVPSDVLSNIYKEINKNEFVKYNGMEVKDYFDKKDTASLTLSIS